jgi:hypothetical protein
MHSTHHHQRLGQTATIEGQVVDDLHGISVNSSAPDAYTETALRDCVIGENKTGSIFE